MHSRRWLLALPLLAMARLAAHDLYFMPERFVTTPGAQLRVVFQNGDDFPEASSPTRPQRLRDTRLLANAGTAEFTAITAEAKRTTANVAVPGAGLAILTARTIPNFIELDAKKFHEYLEHENLSNVIEWRAQHGEQHKPGRERYSKYVKAIISGGKPDAFFNHPAGLTIEIVPLADPYSLAPGQRLAVQLLFRGKPAAGVALESAWLEQGKAKLRTVGRTDAEGRITVPIEASGPHRLHAIVMERCAEPQAADWESFWASLTFEVPAAGSTLKRK